MKLLSLLMRRWQRGLAVFVAAMFAVTGLSSVTGLWQVGASAATTITLTEEDYFTTPGQIAGLAAYSKQFRSCTPRRDRNEDLCAVPKFRHETPDSSRGPRPA